ncbi:hypothetical protein CFIMG_003165RA [Ceratocystis fimbriata CBS 114723]|uniref:Uncharacterized protein n=1 Tax=Ceratocystis fimbriata CBS 114723 TaxID=1035309 RepID=A0A2C5XAZ1_9PEZI|nr:hypothetical protein CFIMG_003165RA [Ceratocystis fimbriata CBS 114723]
MAFSLSAAFKALIIALGLSITDIGVHGALRTSLSSHRSLAPRRDLGLHNILNEISRPPPPSPPPPPPPQSERSLTTATDGSKILDGVVEIEGLKIRYKVSAPVALFMTGTRIPGAAGIRGVSSDLGLNVLIHGDGGEGFDDFPNQGVRENLAGIVLQAPNQELNWGGVVLILSFDSDNVFFTGISGGAMLLTGYFIPTFMHELPNTGALLLCGAMPPQVPWVKAKKFIGNTRFHFQSTKNELDGLGDLIIETIDAFSETATKMRVSDNRLDKLQTVNNDPKGGHCIFDGVDFYSSIKLMAESYPNIMQKGGDGIVPGIGNVLDGTTTTILSFDKAVQAK